MAFLTEITNIAIYSILGIVFMMLGNFLLDLVVPCHFPTEIKKGHQAVGWLSAGSFIAIGLILRTAIMSPSAEAVSESLASGILNTSLYFVLGVVFLILGYVVVSIGLILRTAIMSPSAEAVSESLASGILNTSLYFVLGVVFLILGYVVVSLFNKRYNLNEEIGNRNVAAGLMVFGIFIGLALVISGVIS